MTDDQHEIIEPRLIWKGETIHPVPGSQLQLQASRCTECSFVHFPLRDRCSSCFARCDRIPLTTEGTLTSFTAVLHEPPDASINVPYAVGMVRFPENIEILGLMSTSDLALLQVGQRVTTVFIEYAPRKFTYAFDPLKVPGDHA